jgi:hypothetical protein
MGFAGRFAGAVAKVPGMSCCLYCGGNGNRYFGFHRDVLPDGVGGSVRGSARVFDGQMYAWQVEAQPDGCQFKRKPQRPSFSAAPGATQGAAPPQAEVPEQVTPYLKPQRLVRIQGGRTINLVCLGQGSPTVVLTAGMGGWSLVWNRIQGPLSQKTRVCAWDPAGLGFSSPSPEPRDPIHKPKISKKH